MEHQSLHPLRSLQIEVHLFRLSKLFYLKAWRKFRAGASDFKGLMVKQLVLKTFLYIKRKIESFKTVL